MVEPARPVIHTIGHSNHSVERLLELLATQGITMVVDVRSHPYSRHAAQFNHAALVVALAQAGLQHAYMGDALGGMPSASGFYDADGHVRYDLVASSPRFQEGVARLIGLASEQRIALLCAEEDPRHCHRHLLLARVLGEQQVAVWHLRGDGSREAEAELRQAAEIARTHGQQSLFDDDERPWRSARPAAGARPA